MQIIKRQVAEECSQEARYKKNFSNFIDTVSVGIILSSLVLFQQGRVSSETFMLSCTVLGNLSCQYRKFAKESNDRLDKILEELDE